MRCAHDFSNDRKSRFLLCGEEVFDTLCLKTLEVVGGRARLERAAAEHCSACRLNCLCNLNYLLLTFNRAGTCHNCENIAANACVVYVDNRVLGVELSVCRLKGLGNAANRLDDVKRAEKILVDFRRVTDKTDDCGKFT